MRRVIATPWVLMGEQHDHPQHHRLRAGWLSRWAKGVGRSGTGRGADPGPVAVDVEGAHHLHIGSRIMIGQENTSGTVEPALKGGSGAATVAGAAIVFEHFDREHAGALAQLQRIEPEAPLERWLAAAQFDEQGWGEERYRPLFEAAQRSGLPWIAANFSRREARALMRAAPLREGSDHQGAAESSTTPQNGREIPPARMPDRGADGADSNGAGPADAVAGGGNTSGADGNASGVDGNAPGAGGHIAAAGGNMAGADSRLRGLIDQADWDAAVQLALADAVRVGHCHALPESMLEVMVRVQRWRDAALALPFHEAGPKGRRLLLAGNGHVNRRFGVPRYLPAWAAPVSAGARTRVRTRTRPTAPIQARRDATPRTQYDAGARAQPRLGAQTQGQVVVIGFETMAARRLAEAMARIDVERHATLSRPRRPGQMQHSGRTTGNDAGQARKRPTLAQLVGAERAAKLAASYDVVVLTPPVPDLPDPCEAFRKRRAGVEKS
ncbi:MAG: ChaN family lipoprotein [Lautropia sp.]|nr:ChaN family lipoprotein [Lautropia sp.]